MLGLLLYILSFKSAPLQPVAIHQAAPGLCYPVYLTYGKVQVRQGSVCIN